MFFIPNLSQYWYLSIAAQETSKHWRISHICSLLSMTIPFCGLKSISTDLDLIKFAIYVQSMLWKQFWRIYFSYTVAYSGLHKGYMMDSTLTLQHLGFSVIMYMFWMLRWAGILLSSHLTLGPQWLYTSLINCMSPVVIQFYSVLIQKMIQSCFKTKIHVADRASKLSQVYKRSLKALLHFPHQNRKTWYV